MFFLNELSLNDGWIYVDPRVKYFVWILFFIKSFKDTFLINKVSEMYEEW